MRFQTNDKLWKKICICQGIILFKYRFKGGFLQSLQIRKNSCWTSLRTCTSRFQGKCPTGKYCAMERLKTKKIVSQITAFVEKWPILYPIDNYRTGIWKITLHNHSLDITSSHKNTFGLIARNICKQLICQKLFIIWC